MKVLLVEDDLSFSAVLEETLTEIPRLELFIARSRDSAVAHLQRAEFDLIINDLVIPTADGQLDAVAEHGEAVLAHVRRHCPGTPVVILSAFGSQPFAVETVREATRVDVVGDRVPTTMTGYYSKDEVAQCVANIASLNERIRQTDGIEIRRAGTSLTSAEERLVRIFARRMQGHLVEVERIGGGFSETSTLRVSVTGSEGQLNALVFAKIGSLNELADEATRYSRYVSPLLPIGSFSSLVDRIDGGAGSQGALFYQLGEPMSSLFELVGRNEGKAVKAVNALREHTKPWYVDAPKGQVRVGDIRFAVEGEEDSGASAIFLTERLARIESQTVLSARSVQHGDLHGENVLIGRKGPVVIDFGTVRELFAGFDAVTLELSLLFHPDGRKLLGSWPSKAQLEGWFNLTAYTKDCPIPAFVSASREWALAVSQSDRALLAMVYAYCVRQLRYLDTDKAQAHTLINHALVMLEQ
jgi:DNA-binding NarL/FixJ family response regulator